jgi:hypothetical protein
LVLWVLGVWGSWGSGCPKRVEVYGVGGRHMRRLMEFRGAPLICISCVSVVKAVV